MAAGDPDVVRSAGYEPPSSPSEIIPKPLSEDAYIALQKLYYDHELARLGLQGTLWGAWASLLTIALVVLVPAFTIGAVIRGWEIVGLVLVFVVPILGYGAYIFGVTLNLAAKASKEEASLKLRTSPPKNSDSNR
jgi:hypothetical protein